MNDQFLTKLIYAETLNPCQDLFLNDQPTLSTLGVSLWGDMLLIELAYKRQIEDLLVSFDID